MRDTKDILVPGQETRKDEKAETTINIEEKVENKDNLDKTTLDQEINVTHILDKDEALNVNTEHVLSSFVIQQMNTVIHHDNKQLDKGTHWVQYNKAYIDQDQVRGPKQSFGREGLGGGNFEPAGEPLNYDPQTRNAFVKLVFVILMVMLLLTAAYAITVMMTPGLKRFYLQYALIILIAAMIFLFAMNCALMCVEWARRPPCNFVFLALVVVAMSNLVAVITIRYKTHILVYALAATAATVLVCILLACSSFDFTKFYIYVVAISVVFIVISFMVWTAMFILQIHYKPLQIVLLFVGALINVAMLIMELQMVLGGRAIELGEDDYAIAVYFLYTSIIDLFLKFVQLIGMGD